jgi:hypothetical protein
LLPRKKYFFYLNYDEKEARIYVIVNKHKMYLDKMSIQLKMEFSASMGFEYVLFYGKDYNSGKPVIENMKINSPNTY